MSSSIIEILEQQEVIDKLIKHGHEKLINVLLNNEKQVYTKKGRLNKCGACRVLGWKSKQLEDALLECQEILADDFD
mgnify:CR=1 FL=1